MTDLGLVVVCAEKVKRKNKKEEKKFLFLKYNKIKNHMVSFFALIVIIKFYLISPLCKKNLYFFPYPT